MQRAAGARPAQVVAAKILRAERAIEIEIERNGGTYPHNGGALSEDEVCRRAGLSPLALRGVAHSAGTRFQLAAWLRRITAPREAAGERSRRPQSPALRSQLEQIAHHYQRANLAVATLRLRVHALEQRRREILREFESLEAKPSPPPAARRRRSA